ncbi:MAG: TonB family protein, partial [Methylococcales bacterium]
NGLLSILSKHDELRRKGYTAIVKVWLKPDGAVERVELSKGSNDADIDELLSRLLRQFTKVSEPPPPGMPQPIKLKISSRV